MLSKHVATTNTDSRAGLIYGSAAYLCWGFSRSTGPCWTPRRPYEVLAHRIVWTLVFCVGLLTITRKWAAYRVDPGPAPAHGPLALASVVITLNWGGFIWGVTTGTSSRRAWATSSTR